MKIHRLQLNSRAGFTIVELLVSISILGLLISLLLPAVQRVRESSRDTDCRNRLHHFGIAMHSHEELHHVFPTSEFFHGSPTSRITKLTRNPANYWRCPSDRRFDEAASYISYLVNDGLDGLQARHIRGLGDGFSISRASTRDLRASDVTDGLSQTAAVAERLLIPISDNILTEPELRADPNRYIWYLSSGHQTLDTLTHACRNDRLTPYPMEISTSGSAGGQGYDHILTPNEIGCQPDSSVTSGFYHVIPASSEHPGHVNVLMGDGAVRSVANGIELVVWRAVGTRNGNEVLGEF